MTSTYTYVHICAWGTFTQEQRHTKDQSIKTSIQINITYFLLCVEPNFENTCILHESQKETILEKKMFQWERSKEDRRGLWEYEQNTVINMRPH